MNTPSSKPDKKIDATEAPTVQPVSEAAGEPTLGGEPAPSPGSESFQFLAPAQQPDEIGRLGHYRVLKVLGQGGMGMVFLAEDTKLDRHVALKVMLPKFAEDHNAKQRFIREAKTAAKIEHDHIIAIYQVGDDQSVPFIAMPLLKGISLEDFLKQRQAKTETGPLLKLPQILRLGREIAKGLAAAHEHGLIHRDIKPANIWLDSTAGGRVKILDFGLARPTSGEQNITQSGVIVGTPSYMAPEQAQPQKTIDARADLFSLGVILYRMCTGLLPFHGDDMMTTLMSLATHDPAPPISLSDLVPPALSDLVMQLLAKDPQNRPASAKAVAQALQGIEKGSPDRSASEVQPEATFAPDENSASAARSASKGVSEPTLAYASGSEIAAPRRRPIFLLALLALAALIAAGIVFFLQTPTGTLRVEINDPDIEVTLSKTGAVFKGPDKKHDISLAPGEHGLKIKRGDFEFETDKFVIRKGEIVALKVEFLKGQVQVATAEGKIVGVKGMKVEEIRPLVTQWALEFNGKGNHVALPPTKFNPKVGLTIEAFVYPLPSGNDLQIFSSCDSQTGFGLTIFRDGGGWGGGILSQNGKPGQWYGANCNSRVPWGQWSHLALVFDGASVRLFRNGQEITVYNEKPSEVFTLIHPGNREGNVFPGLARPANAPTLLGDDDLHRYFMGKLFGVRISNGPRYLNNFTPPVHSETDANTLALYHFDEGQGDKLVDSSGNGHHGKIVGAKWVKANATPIDTDRRAAAWVLSLGGIVQVDGNEKDIIKAEAELPKGGFQLSGVELRGNAEVSDAGLIHLQDCKHITRLSLAYTKVTDDGVARLQLHKGCDRIELESTGVTDAGMTRFQGMKGVNVLFLTDTKVGDAGLANFKDCKRLRELRLGQTAVSDVSVPWLCELKELSELVLKGSKVSAKGIETLKNALPNCRIEWNGGGIEPTAALQRRAANLLHPFAHLTCDLGKGKSITVLPEQPIPDGDFDVKTVFIPLTAKIPPGFVPKILLPAAADLPRLSRLEVAENLIDLSAAELAQLAALPCARELNSLRIHVDVNDKTIQDLRKFPQLKFFGCRLGGQNPRPFELIASLPKLEWLTWAVRDGSFTKETAAALTKGNLVALTVIGAQSVDQEALVQLGQWTSIEALELYRCGLEDKHVGAIAKLQSLKRLKMPKNKLTDAALVPLAGLKNLEELALLDNPVSEAPLRRLQAALPKCRITWTGGLLK